MDIWLKVSLLVDSLCALLWGVFVVQALGPVDWIEPNQLSVIAIIALVAAIVALAYGMRSGREKGWKGGSVLAVVVSGVNIGLGLVLVVLTSLFAYAMGRGTP